MNNRQTKWKRRGALPAAVAMSAFMLAACGGADSEAEAASSGKIRITTLGLCNEIPVYWAQEKGIFKQNGLDVELVKSTGGAAALTALQSGDIDLAFTNPFSTMIAVSQGIELKWIATAYETTEVPGRGTNAVTVAKDTGIKEARDLNGKTIGVNEIGGINQIITTAWLKQKGADVKSVQFVALPFSDLAPAVASKKIGAAQVPAQNVNPKLGLVSLDDPYVSVGGGKRLIFAGYVATSKQATSRQKDFEAFQKSLVAADEQISSPANSEAKFALESAKCKQDAAYLSTLNENIYEANVSKDALDRMGAILRDQNLVTSPVKADDLVPSYVTTH